MTATNEIDHKTNPQTSFLDDEETMFPEPEGTEEEGIEIEVVDDVPEEDRGKPATPVEEPEADAIDENELEQYSEGVQKRIKQLRFEYHTERRAREAAERQNQEAIRYAQQIAANNEHLKRSIDSLGATLTEALDKQSNAELDAARLAFTEASESGDTEKMLAAQEKIASAIADMKSRPQPPTTTVAGAMTEEQPQGTSPGMAAAPQPQQQVVTAEEQQWFVKNDDWFNKNPEMTSFAYGVHENLLRQGYNPRQSPDKYFAALDKRMREVFPDYEFASQEEGQASTPVKQKPATVVAPVTRTGSTSRKVQLTPTQVSLAKKLGLTVEQYAQQLLKEGAANG